ncbi:hypothetical protein MTO96_002553 [Rhipicephalus appendiculatus]
MASKVKSGWLTLDLTRHSSSAPFSEAGPPSWVARFATLRATAVAAFPIASPCLAGFTDDGTNIDTVLLLSDETVCVPPPPLPMLLS